jgi:hypothetical protein
MPQTTDRVSSQLNVEDVYKTYLPQDEQTDMDDDLAESLRRSHARGSELLILPPESVDRIKGGFMSEESEKNFGDRALEALDLYERLSGEDSQAEGQLPKPL